MTHDSELRTQNSGRRTSIFTASNALWVHGKTEEVFRFIYFNKQKEKNKDHIKEKRWATLKKQQIASTEYYPIRSGAPCWSYRLFLMTSSI